MKKFNKKEMSALVQAVEKLASDSSTEFNETVPAANTEQLEAQQAANAEQSVAPTGARAIPAQVPVQEHVPEEEYVEAPPEGPEAIGARAAQSFLGPEIMQAATAGDPAAADLVARTAGQVAGAVTEAVARSGGGAAPMEGEVPNEEGLAPEMAPAIATPEEDLANEIVPATQPAAMPAPGQVPQGQVPQGQVPPENAEGEKDQRTIDQGKNVQTTVAPDQSAAAVPAGGEGEKVDMADVKKLIELARAGKI